MSAAWLEVRLCGMPEGESGAVVSPQSDPAYTQADADALLARRSLHDQVKCWAPGNSLQVRIVDVDGGVERLVRGTRWFSGFDEGSGCSWFI